MKRKTFWVVTVLVIAALLLVTGGSFYLVGYALVNPAAKRNVDMQMNRVLNQQPDLKPWLDSLQQAHALRDTFIVTAKGTRLHAIFVRDPRACGRTAVLVHGYQDMSVRMLPIASIYSRMGYNVLLPDLHGHGKSDGDDIQMGWKDRIDVMRWMNEAERMFRVDSCVSRMVVHGVSMGAATTMCVSGEPQPDYVRCFVEDCGYTSVWDEFAHELKSQFHLPAFPLLYTSDILCRLKYGWGFTEASPLKQVAKSKLPMLFIHGDKDDFVPFSMLQPLYEAKTQPRDSMGRVEKEIWVVPGTEHAKAYHDHPVEYTQRVKRFVSRYMR